MGPVEGPAQHMAGIALERGAVEVDDVAEHPGHLGLGHVAVKPTWPWPCQGRSWKVLASGRASTSLSCTRLNPSMAEPSKVIPSSRAFSSSAGVMEKVFGVPEHVGEPQLDEPDPALLHRPEDVLLLTPHGVGYPRARRGRSGGGFRG